MQFYLLITNNETKYRVQLPDRCDSRTILKESFECIRAFVSFCQFNYFILIDTTIVSSLLLTTIIHNCADTNFFFFLLLSLPLEFSFSSKFFQGCLHFPLETFIQTVEKFRSGLITSRNFRARFFTLENFIFLEEGTNYGSCTTLKYFTPSFQGGFFDDFAHDSKEHVGGDVYIYIV